MTKQNSFSVFLEKFRRITSAGNYIPEIDGLRFVSIFWVAVLMHIMNLLNQRLFNGQFITSTYWRSVFLEGGYGVSLFMVISGFILSLPFIKEKLCGAPKVSLGKYYLRRLTRLEPPYLVALTIAFILLVFVVDRYSFTQLLPHYGASSIYMHNVIYDKNSLVLGVAWSLELEIQYYILAPFLCYIFLLKNHLLRRSILAIATLLSSVYAYYQFWTLPVILPNFICYFIAGMLLADFYCRPPSIPVKGIFPFLFGLSIMIGLPLLISLHSLYAFLAKVLLLFIFFYLVLMNPRLKRVMSIQWITIIGGMCYTIYLLHFLVISATTALLREFSPEPGVIVFIGCVLLLVVAVLIVSAVFYKLIEQPCMRKDWYKNIFRKKKKVKLQESHHL